GPRSGQDVYIIYTGGTTGMPKGAMWHVEDLFMAFGAGNPTGEPRTSPQQVIDEAVKAGPIAMMAAAPLMHGAAQMGTFIAFWLGAMMVYVRTFDADEVWRAVERERVLTMNITGDAMARPLAEALERGSYDVSSLFVLSSTGAILSGAVRDRLQELLPHVPIRHHLRPPQPGHTADRRQGRPHRVRLLQRPRQDRPHLHHHRGRHPLAAHRRPRHRRGGRHHRRARPRLAVRQHRRREGVPRGGGGGAQGPPRRLRRRRHRRARRTLGEPGGRRGRAAPRRRGHRRRPRRPLPQAAVGLQGAPLVRVRAACGALTVRQGRLPLGQRDGPGGGDLTSAGPARAPRWSAGPEPAQGDEVALHQRDL